ncbi:MAG: HpcH/HpaI aldolase family protein [Eubacteriales bacterium]
MKVKLREILESGNYALGGFLSIGAPSIVEVVALGGLDFVIIDTEHGEANFESVVNMIRAAEAHGITAIIRMTDYDQKMIGRYLDNGAHGIQVPMVETGEMAQKVVAACKYAPDGLRGLSGGRGSKWGHIKDYTVTVNRELMTICMCETKLAVDNIEEIVKTPNLDVLFIGTGDLSQSLGCTGEKDHPLVIEAVNYVLRACKKYNVIPGIVTGSAAEAAKYIRQGFRYVTVLNDMRLICATTEKITKEIRNQ